MCAAKYGEDCYIDALIRAGADVNRKKFRLDRPLTTAVMNGKFNLAKSLIKAGADMTDRYCLMIWLCEVVLKGETKNIKILLQAGLNDRVPTRPRKPGKMRVHLENLEISWNFEKFNKYHGKMT